MNEYSIPQRPRRNRKSSAIREALAETQVKTSNLLYPMFLLDGSGKREEISSMPGIFRQSEEHILKEVRQAKARRAAFSAGDGGNYFSKVLYMVPFYRTRGH